MNINQLHNKLIKKAYTPIEVLLAASLPVAGGLSLIDNSLDNPDETMKNIGKALAVGPSAMLSGAYATGKLDQLSSSDDVKIFSNDFNKNLSNDIDNLKRLNQKFPKLRAVLTNTKKAPFSALAALLRSNAALPAASVLGASLGGYGMHKLLKNNKNNNKDKDLITNLFK